MNILSTIFDMSLLIFKSCRNFCQLLPCASFKSQRFVKHKTIGILSRIPWILLVALKELFWVYDLREEVERLQHERT